MFQYGDRYITGTNSYIMEHFYAVILPKLSRQRTMIVYFNVRIDRKSDLGAEIPRFGCNDLCYPTESKGTRRLSTARVQSDLL